MDLDAALRDLAPRLLRYAIGRTGDPALAEDIAQESLTALVQRCGRSGPPDSPEAFVFSIARRRAGRAALKKRLLLPLTVIAGAADATRTPEDLAIADDRARAVRAAFAALPKLDREALLLVAAGELRTAEAARVLGVSESAVRMRTMRGRRRLAALLEGNHGYRPQRQPEPGR